tara:strand:+ start:85 stop:720 length:636 start_codon:yes stop_codon:yes gene_type:complete
MLSKRFVSFTVDNITEHIIKRTSYPLDKCKKILKNQIISVIGYGPQGRRQATNLRDSGFDVILGVRNGFGYQQAINDGWKDHIDLFCIEEAVERSDIIQYLLSDIGQMKQWDNIYPYLKTGNTLYFSHNFGITYPEQTKIIPPDNIDIIMTVRDKFLNKENINVSYSIHQDYTGEAKEKCLAYSFAIGYEHAVESTFKNKYTLFLSDNVVY